jgi:hypothetical protein
MLRYPHAKATLKGKDGRWSANTHEVWCQATGLSSDQVQRRFTKLDDELGLIERAYGAWGGKPKCCTSGRPNTRR